MGTFLPTPVRKTMGGSQQGAQKGARPTSAALELGGGLGKSEQDIKRRQKEEKLHYGHGSNNTLQQAKSQKHPDSQQHE